MHELQGHKERESGWSRKSDEMKDMIRELPSVLGMLRFPNFTPVVFQAVKEHQQKHLDPEALVRQRLFEGCHASKSMEVFRQEGQI